MKKLILRTNGYNDIPWYMFNDELYTIEKVSYDNEDDPALIGMTEYFVYIIL